MALWRDVEDIVSVLRFPKVNLISCLDKLLSFNEKTTPLNGIF